VVTGLLFLAATLFAPLAQAIPAAATSPALVLVGALMMGSVGEVDWSDPITAIPAFLILITIPLTYSIANGLAFGIVAFATLTLVTGRARTRDWLTFALATLCVARFIYMARG
jgi:AGZA family xanthine/uracil permease-like MFS transporter